MSNQDSFNAGNSNQPLPPGGDLNSWQAGQGVRQWNDAERARQEAVWMPKADTGFQFPKATLGPITFGTAFTGSGKGLRGNPILAIVGLIALIFVGAPLYQYSIPLWAALYPLAAIGTVAVFAGVTAGLKEFIFAAASAFIAAWPLTIVEHALSTGRTYWMFRHVVRLVLVFVWAIYALTLRELNAKHIPDLAHGGLPQMHFTVPHLALAAAAVAVMHLWLWKFRTWS